MASCYSQAIVLSLCISTMAYDQSQFKAVPMSALSTGVFMIPTDGTYNFTANGASSECRRLAATLATMGQMEEALERGFQTCKYGWIQGPKAVIPRKVADSRCGQGKIGLVTWTAVPDKTFAAFCFKDTPTTPAVPVTFRPMTSVPRSPSVWTRASTKVARNMSRPPPLTKPQRKPMRRPPAPKPVLPPKPTQRWSWFSSPSSPAMSSASSPPPRSTSPASPPPAVTSRSSARKLKSTRATPVQASSLPRFALRPSSSSPTTTTTTLTPPPTTTTTTTLTTTTTPTPTTTSTSSKSSIPKSLTEMNTHHSSKAPMGAVPLALSLVGIVVLVLTVAVACWYYKLPRCLFPPPWSRPQLPRSGVETEMSKPIHSDTDLQTQLTDEEITNGKNACEVPISQSETNTNAEV